MENVLYFLQTNVCIGAFYALYIIFFRKSTFFRANRIYLLTALLFSFAIPVMDFPTVPVDYHLPASDLLSVGIQDLIFESEALMDSSGTESFNFLVLVYWIGFGVIIVRLFSSIVGLIRITNLAGVCKEGSTRIVRMTSSQPFSFFNLIFLPTANVDPIVLEHEKAHVRYYHWVDLLLVEIVSAILWFNPLMIFYKKSIKIQHEYEADSYVIKAGISIPKYLDCILRHLQTETLTSPVSEFYSQNIKKRIIMITKQKTPFRLFLLYTLFIPVASLLLFAFSKPSIRSITYPTDSNGRDKASIVIVVDAGHGGHDKGGAGAEMLHEKEFTLAMARNIREVGEAKNIKVILTRTDDNAMGLEDRINVARKHNADLFISIHANDNQENGAASGIECVVSEKSRRFEDSERLAGKVVQQFRTLKGISVNGIKKANYYVLAENNVPAILLNLGFFSNKSDYAYLSDKTNQREISQRIIDAVLEYTK